MKKGKRKAQAAKARAFYARRQAAKRGDEAAPASYGGDVLPPDEAGAMAPWRGCGVVAAAVVVLIVLGWAVEKLF